MLIRSRLRVIALLPVAVFLAMLVAYLYINETIEASNEKLSAADDVARKITELRILTREAGIFGSERARQQWRRQHTLLGADLQRFTQLFREDEERPYFEDLLNGYMAAGRLFGDLWRVASGAEGNGANRPVLQERLASRLVLELEGLVLVTEKLHALAHQRASRFTEYRVWAFFSSMALLVTLVPAMVFLVARGISRPIILLQTAFEKMGAGELSSRTGLKSDSELGRLAVGFDTLAEHLRETMVSRDALAAEIKVREGVEHNLRESEARFRNAMENAPIGMVLVALDGRFMEVNKAMCNIVGYGKEELERLGFADITHPDDLAENRELIGQLLEKQANLFRLEKRYLRKEGSIVWVQLTATLMCDEQGEPLYFIGQIEDITERKAFQRELERLANTDALTGMANRKHFMEQAHLEAGRARRYKHPLSVLMIDLDHFKAINDTHGHQAGDLVLQKFADICRAALRDVDVAGRVGGEEFALLLPETDVGQAFQTAERLRQAVAAAEVAVNHGTLLRFTVSIGVATLTEMDGDVYAALKRADRALYEAKRSRDRVCRAEGEKTG